jgi:uncharacterized protein YsxB (DUF464 family)
MTEIKVIIKSGVIKGYVVDGHSGYGQEGTDIVCAALSVLAITGANALEEVAGIKAEIHNADGYLSVMLPEDIEPDAEKQADIILRTIVSGFDSVSKEYPTYVSMKRRRCD